MAGDVGIASEICLARVHANGEAGIASVHVALATERGVARGDRSLPEPLRWLLGITRINHHGRQAIVDLHMRRGLRCVRRLERRHHLWREDGLEVSPSLKVAWWSWGWGRSRFRLCVPRLGFTTDDALFPVDPPC
jgi:hypothetical protein